ncbi:hypothetical protein CBR_g17851 [Chara braunii]|uniref:F-box domain-containing protein n=1 Tax=Chara braunii TaxID=69332 RepID=A0A388KVQ1_CHABU|nr:hypothetical protein CBR_g17851 [Chara braunii]|eukprot:GBG74140.1 hypothetical protein CBR_g17851 [Chara braunii]
MKPGKRAARFCVPTPAMDQRVHARVSGRLRDASDHDGDGRTVDGMDWSTLPKDVLVCIFSYLPMVDRFRVGGVCSNWRLASRHHLCWTEGIVLFPPLPWRNRSPAAAKDVIRRSKGRVIELSVNSGDHWLMEHIGRKCPRIEHLTFQLASGGGACWNRAAKAVAEGCPALRSLALSIFSQVSDSEGVFVRQLVSGLRNLVALSIYTGPYEPVTDDDVNVIVASLPGLQSLYLFGTLITDASLHKIGEKLRCLRFLSVYYCNLVTRVGVDSLRTARQDLQVWSSYD